MCLETTVTTPSRPMRMKGPKGPKSVSLAPSDRSEAGEQPTSRAPPAATAEITTTSRRVGSLASKVWAAAFMVLKAPSGHGDAGGVLDGRADALVGSTATDVAAHGGVDVGVRRLGRRRQQGGGRHDLPRLAVAALRHVALDPGRLHRVRAA